MSEPIYILCTPAVYGAARNQGIYRTESLITEGFIHASPADRLNRVANAYFSKEPVLCLLHVDPGQVPAEIRWERAKDGYDYPHIYGVLPMEAVVRAQTIRPGPDGTYHIDPGEPG